MIEVIFEYTQTKTLRCLKLLDSKEIVLLSENECLKKQTSNNNVAIELYSQLLCNRDKGDTKVVLYASKILDDDSDVTVTICSTSVDTDNEANK